MLPCNFLASVLGINLEGGLTIFKLETQLGKSRVAEETLSKKDGNLYQRI